MFHAIWFMLFVALHRNLAFVMPLTVVFFVLLLPSGLGNHSALLHTGEPCSLFLIVSMTFAYVVYVD